MVLNYGFYYKAFTVNSIQNIVFEFKVTNDHYKTLLSLKLTNTDTNEVWYSSPFQCTNILSQETIKINYKNESFLKGVPYDTQDYFQSVRLACFKNDIEQEVDNEEILQLSGNKIYSRNIVTDVNNFKFYFADHFTFKRLSFLLDHSLVYINNYRHFSSPSKITKGERVEDSNLITLDFTANPTDEYRDFPLQLITELYNDIYADNINYNFTYSHTPINSANDGNWFLVNLLFTNYHNPFGITLDANLKIRIESVPIKGFLANNLTRHIYAVNDLISYTDKDDLVYYPNGFDNDLGISNNFIEGFSYKIIDQNGYVGRLISDTMTMTDSASTPIAISTSITFYDDTSTTKTGNAGMVDVKLSTLVFDPADPVVTKQWEVFDGTNWVLYINKTNDTQSIDLSYLENKIRFKAVSQFGETAYSNVLTYEKTSSANIYITDVVSSVSTGSTTYKLHVENEAFVGFANTVAQKDNIKNGRLNSTYAPIFIPNAYAPGEIATNSQAVNIPIGIYDLEIRCVGIRLDSSLSATIDSGISYGLTGDYYSPASPSAVVNANLIINQM